MSDNLTLCTPKELSGRIGLHPGEIAAFKDQGCKFFGDRSCIEWVRDHIDSVAIGDKPYVPFKTAKDRKPIPTEIREAVLARDEFKCHYCGEEAEYLEMDHVVPFSAGGEDTAENLVTACRSCNRSKKAIDYETFKASRRATA